VNDWEEFPSEFEHHGNDLVAALNDALQRRAWGEVERLKEELKEHNEKHAELLEEKYGDEFGSE
jgi:polyphosphate kinase